MKKIDKKILKKVYPRRKKDVRKYDFGMLLIIGGGEFYSGSPALVALSAFRAGVDMVQILAPQRAADIVASFSPILASFPLKGEKLNLDHLATLLSFVKSAQMVTNNKVAIVIGGGIGRSEETQTLVLEFLKEINLPCLIDADGLHALAKNPGIVSKKPFLLTPHSYEFFILTGQKVEKRAVEEKIEKVQKAAQNLKVTILLKGKIDIIANEEGKIALNETGSPFMTKGGTGDTLAGIAGALLSKNIDPFTTACAAAFLNGQAGQKAAKKFSHSLLPTDLIEEIPQILKRV